MPGRLRKKIGERHASERISGGRARVSRKKTPLADFLEKEIRTDDGVFTFEGREAMREVVDYLDDILRLSHWLKAPRLAEGSEIG